MAGLKTTDNRKDINCVVLLDYAKTCDNIHVGKNILLKQLKELEMCLTPTYVDRIMTSWIGKNA